MKRAVVAGHICLDIIPSVDHHFDLIPGRLYEVGGAAMSTGGAVSNTGVCLHILGIPTTLMGKLGDDHCGSTVRAVLRAHGKGLDTGMAVVPGAVTSYTVVVNIPGIDRIFLHCPGANGDFTTADIDECKLKGAALFHFGYPAFMAATYANDGAQLVKMYSRMKELGLTTSLDLGMPDASGPGGKADWLKILTRALPHVDIFMPSGDELLYALDRKRFGQGDNLTATDLAPLAQRLLDMGVAIVGIKLGSRGMYLRTGSAERLGKMGGATPKGVKAWANRELWFPVYQVPKVVGTTGSGDTTIAGFLAALLRGESVERCGCMANAVGACNVQAVDAVSGIRTWDATVARLDAGWKHDPFAIKDAGWRRNPTLGIWHGPAEN